MVGWRCAAPAECSSPFLQSALEITSSLPPLSPKAVAAAAAAAAAIAAAAAVTAVVKAAAGRGFFERRRVGCLAPRPRLLPRGIGSPLPH